jgi:hypothetical protein
VRRYQRRGTARAKPETPRGKRHRLVAGLKAAGHAVGESGTINVPEPSTWAMTLFGFAGLALVSGAILAGSD